MRNTPKGLNEELMKMRKLMNFDISENSHDVLSENFVKKSIISEQEVEGGGQPNWEWIKKELQKAKTIVNSTPECFQVGSEDNRIKGFFNAKVTEGSTAVNDFVGTLMNEIKNNPNAKKYIGTGGKFAIESMDIIAGASNSLNGSMPPTMDNNYKPLNITKGSPEDLNYDHPIDSKAYDKNMGYAKGRGEGVRDGLIKAFNSDKIKGFKMNSENITISNYIIDTGGKIDIESTSENKGQVVLVFMKVCWENTEKTEIPAVVEEFKRCMGGVSVQVNYDKDSGHSCNNATFKISANGVPLKRTGWGETDTATDSNKISDYADLNNGADDEKVLDERDAGAHGGKRYNEFKIEGDELGEIVSFDSLREYKGNLQIEAECIETTTGEERKNWFDKRPKIYYYKGNELPPSFIYDGEMKYLYNPKGEVSNRMMKNYLIQKYREEICNDYGCDSKLTPSKIYRELKNKLAPKAENASVKIVKKLTTNSSNPHLGRFGCHKGVATVKIMQNDGTIKTKEGLSTPRYADNTLHNLGPIMEACNAKWNLLVDASKKVGEGQG